MNTRLCRTATVFFTSILFSGAILFAQNAENPPLPQPVPMPPPVATPADKPYVGPIDLTVDVTNVNDRVAHVHETIPVSPNEKVLTLLYPKWIPGNHSPTGPISHLAGIVTHVDGKRVQWVRDRVDVFAFNVPLNAGAKSVDLDFDYLSPQKHTEGRIETSDAIIDLQWNKVLMYPAGYFTRDIPFDVTLKIPDGWKYATALETASAQGSTLKFQRTNLEMLVDSPLYAGIHYKRIDLSPAPSDPVHLDVFADEEKDLDISPDALQKHKQLAIEADKLYQSHHYKHYDFLLLLSNTVGGIGLEHHQSSEDGTRATYFTNWSKGGVLGRDLLAHEYTHSWNGKFRRPADLWTPNFNVPMRDDLLWVYEGMTQYWGTVLTARAGMRTKEQTRDLLASIAAHFEISPGRDWRPLVDTTNQPTISQRRPVSWVSWQLPEDYYTEGELIWLDADTKIRELTHGQKSLDDFAQAFLGVYNGSYGIYTYSFDDLVKIMNSVVPYDWATFFRQRVYDLHPAVPEDGFTRGGYKLVYSDKEQPWMTKGEAAYGVADFSTSLGFSVHVPRKGQEAENGPKGALANVWWNSPAFKAGVTPNMQIISVNGKAFTPEVLREAILQAEKSKQPIQLQFRRGDEYKNFSIAYYGGLRIPSLQRVEGTPDRLDEILAPSKRPLPAM